MNPTLNLFKSAKPLLKEKANSETTKYSKDGLHCSDPSCQWCNHRRRVVLSASGELATNWLQQTSLNNQTHTFAAILSRAERYFCSLAR